MRNHGLLLIVVLSLGSSVFGRLTGNVCTAGSVPRMEKEELNALLGNADLVILDVRTDFDWRQSEFKVKGAVRESPGKFQSWAEKYPKDRTIVLYCA